MSDSSDTRERIRSNVKANPAPEGNGTPPKEGLVETNDNAGRSTVKIRNPARHAKQVQRDGDDGAQAQVGDIADFLEREGCRVRNKVNKKQSVPATTVGNCTCEGKESDGRMVMCDHDVCERVWFHRKCIDLDWGPEGMWWCVDCAVFAAVARQ
ncbi:hypothetical protein CLAFUW4_02274 [Fulvia fulva]|uniref:Zinc finger PHD-type domain-containing protein n=1 Tax=Passalora fulva TaxID=5499 RepID=A0A9Q8L7F7_PASFU|nr:uncharacterized protein CLAFUR5_02264 [Fulvia fulva]KAK4634147.1 hypothetical protein CLAFUR4_02269 [Fulvia fulva]KAK4637773.1 hypothetical protein CLAFUR0_02273 [Fulvia fulva]UJO12205.1 hypothetical protein CLAFUR5_02264 [Fulvia fulva]WPV09272.1 hypothetical protein CLAFUW4_02274 [Fulvia fulva]WPV23105.1 hypothetical protein CLAFUW7_02274 [Fulvia fulva]